MPIARPIESNKKLQTKEEKRGLPRRTWPIKTAIVKKERIVATLAGGEIKSKTKTNIPRDILIVKSFPFGKFKLGKKLE